MSADDVRSYQKFAQKYALPFPLLADTAQRVSAAYGAWRAKSMYGKTYWGVARLTVLIDVFEKIVPQSHPHEVLTVLQRLQSTE